MAPRTIALDSKNLEGGIEALSNAARAFQLTRFEEGAYGALMASVDMAAWSFLAGIATLSILIAGNLQLDDLVKVVFVVGPWVAFPFAVILGIVSLALNIPLLRKFYRERARLKELGLSSLSKSLWKESRRSRWISRARGALLLVVGIIMVLFFSAVVGGLIINSIRD